MLWEIANDIRRKVKMTIIPSLRNLFSSKKSLVGMLLVMLVLQMLLSVICIAGIENIKNQQVVLKDFKQMLELSDEKQPTPQKDKEGVEDSDSSDTDISTGEAVTENRLVSADTLSTALSSTSIFIGAVIIWGICAVTVYQKVTFAAADRDKYLWGMYITHGAKIKKIRSMLKCELYLPHLAATAVAYPLAVQLYNIALGDQGYKYGHSVITVIAILLLSYVCIRLVVEYECLLIKRMSCTEMLRNEDSPKSVCFPRRHSRLIRGFSAPVYASNAFIRMRKYYLSLAAIAAIPAVIWSCFHVSAVSQDKYLDSDIGEFTLTSKNSISESDLERILNTQLLSIDGVSRATSSAYYTSSQIYTHVLTDAQKYKNTEATPYLTTTYADNSLVLCCSDRVFKQTTGYTMSTISKGTVKILAPQNNAQYNFSEGEEIRIAVSKLDGTLRVVEDAASDLSHDMREDWEYKTFKVASYSTATPQMLSQSSFLNVQKTYFVFHHSDYEDITSVDSKTNQQTISTESLSLTKELDSLGGFNVTLDASQLTKLPTVGDCFSLDGTYDIRVDLTVEENSKTKTISVKAHNEFDYAYINSVTVVGDKVTVNATPCGFITVEEPSMYSFGRYVAMGTPVMPSNGIAYCPATAGEGLVLSEGKVDITSSFVILLTSSEVTAAQAGTHALLTERNIVNTKDKLMLERLYADNSFVIACNDKTTKEALGLDVPFTSKGQAVLVLPSIAYHNYNMSVGDRIRFAVTLAEVSNCSTDSTTAYGSYDTLKQHLKNKYEYVSCDIIEVMYSNSVTKPHFFVSQGDFSRVIHKPSPYITINVYLDAGMESSRYTEIRESINLWATSNRYGTSVSSTGEYLQYLLRKNANYSTLILLISSLIPLIVPFIWYHPMSSLFERRKTEFAVLLAMGKKKRQMRTAVFFEGLMVSLCAFVTVLVMTFPAMLVFKVICILFKLPIAFEYANLTAPVLIAAALFSSLSAAASFVIGYTLTSPRQRKNLHRRKHGNT
jgi:hypothetical protein